MNNYLLAAYLRLLSKHIAQMNYELIKELEKLGIDPFKEKLGRLIIGVEHYLKEESDKLISPNDEKIFKKLMDLDEKISHLHLYKDRR